ncbi:hypothetical protein OEZ85_004101 [Tetradesmus obliquus]|uniref:RAP domain-containing protein n=1 Tax=Tetradesmus obliquus TaxID=3088 RepID=A0ABY8UE85_TETOB|nr:hypothetical protein OEZ85_004101 [Tetradesmus obliquus]
MEHLLLQFHAQFRYNHIAAAITKLSYTAPDLEHLVTAVMGQLPHNASQLSAATAIKLLWVAAVLGEADPQLQVLLLQRLEGLKPRELSQQQLRLLYQAHRLSTQDWLQGAPAGQQQQQGEEDAEDSDAAAAAAAGGFEADEDYEYADQYAEAAAAHFAAASAARSKKQQLHVQDIFEDLGFEAPVKGLRLDAGALQPDLALIASSSKARRKSGRKGRRSAGGLGDDGAAADGVKVAIMCDHAGRYSRNAPHQLLGYETVTGWLLEQAGWKVVRLAPHEWRLLLNDRGVEEGTAMAYVYNTMAAQGVAV